MKVLVTGANKGIGLGIVTAFAQRGDEVVAACRTSSPELAALEVRVVEGIELTSDAAVEGLATAVEGSLDVLVCNAGVNIDTPGLDDIEIERLKTAFDINALGVVRVVLALLPAMGAGSKIFLVTTGGLSTLNIKSPSPGNYGYRMSKAAMVSFGHGLARDIRDRGIAVGIGAPGAVRTDLLQRVFEEGRTPQATLDRSSDILTVGRMLRDRIDELTLEQSPMWLKNRDGEYAIPPEILADLSG